MVVELGAHLVGRGERVVLGHDRPQAQSSVDGDHVLGAVGHDHGYPVAGLDPRLPQQLGGALGCLQELGVRQSRPQEVQGAAFPVEVRGRLQQLAQRGVGDVDDGRDPRLVMRAPVVGRIS